MSKSNPSVFRFYPCFRIDKHNKIKIKIRIKCSWQVKKGDMSKPNESHKPKRKKRDISKYKI